MRPFRLQREEVQYFFIVIFKGADLTVYRLLISEGDFVTNTFTVLKDQVYLPAIVYNFVDESYMWRRHLCHISLNSAD